MKKNILLTAVMTSMVVYLLSSCYRNKEDIAVLPKVSFRKEVVPIMIGGACGCHNNGQAQRAVQFSRNDTIWYDAILARVGTFKNWVLENGRHPGEGAIDFAENEKNIVKRWLQQGDPYDDGAGCVVPATVTYTKDIVPIYTTSCKGGTCHGGIATGLDYNKFVAAKTLLETVLNSGGNQGHPGGALSLSTCTVNNMKAWIAQGMPQ